MSNKKAKQLANHYWNKEEEIETAVKKAVAKGMIKEEEIKEVRRRIEENKKKDAVSKKEAAEREKAREAERISWLQRKKAKKTETGVMRVEQKPEKVLKKIIPPTRKNLRGATVATKSKEPDRKTGKKPKQLKEKRIGRILSLRKATQGDSLGRSKIINKGRSVMIQKFLLFPEDIGIEINTLSAIFTEKKDCFVANFCGVLIKDIPKELRYEDNLKGVFSLVAVKKVKEKWEELYLNLIYKHELNGRPVYIARIDSEKEDPIEGSIHTTPTTNSKMILHLYPV